MLDNHTNHTIIKCATELVYTLREESCIKCDDFDDFYEWVIKSAAIGFVYCYGDEEYDNGKQFYKECIIKDDSKQRDVDLFLSNIDRVISIFDWYGHQYENDNLWILMAYLWEWEIGETYLLSIYERDCLEDREYKRKGSIIKRIVQKTLDCVRRDHEDIIDKEKKIYYSVPGKPLCWSLANHPGKLTREDVVQNLIAAIEKSNDNGEDWIADIKLSWLQPPGMINSTPQETLENKETIRTWAESLTDIWDIDGAKAEALLNEAGVGEELQKLNQELLDELEEESDEWTIIRLLDYLPYESPYC